MGDMYMAPNQVHVFFSIFETYKNRIYSDDGQASSYGDPTLTARSDYKS